MLPFQWKKRIRCKRSAFEIFRTTALPTKTAISNCIHKIIFDRFLRGGKTRGDIARPNILQSEIYIRFSQVPKRTSRSIPGWRTRGSNCMDRALLGPRNDEMEQPNGTAGPNCWLTAHSKLKSASSTATISHSSNVVLRLLQQPARSHRLVQEAARD